MYRQCYVLFLYYAWHPYEFSVPYLICLIFPIVEKLKFQLICSLRNVNNVEFCMHMFNCFECLRCVCVQAGVRAKMPSWVSLVSSEIVFSQHCLKHWRWTSRCWSAHQWVAVTYCRTLCCQTLSHAVIECRHFCHLLQLLLQSSPIHSTIAVRYGNLNNCNNNNSNNKRSKNFDRRLHCMAGFVMGRNLM